LRIDHPPASAVSGIVLRQLERSDVPAWYRYLSMPTVVEHTSWNLSGPEELDALLTRYQSAGEDAPVRFAIVDADNARLAGTIGFCVISSAHGCAELAYDLAPAY
jgi:RimJ/RimL family protein N-acetyltransferase